MATRLRAGLPLLLVIGLLALPVLAGSVFAAPAGKEVQVSVIDNAFEPKVITIDAGDTIVWTNNGQRNHTVTASDGSWDSGRLAPGATFSHTFDTAGTIPYYCIPHGTPDGQGMAGTIVVQAASTGAAPPAQPAQPAQPAPTEQPAATAPSTTVDAHVMVEDQAIVDNSVTVSNVRAAQDGWIVIHTNTADNAPGPVIGHEKVMAGENDNVKVTLSQTPAPGDKLWPMLHIDAGQMGVYEFPGADTPVKMGDKIVMEQMTVLGGAASAPPAAQTPSQLPSAGDSGASNLWISLVGAAAALLLGGFALRYAAFRSRR